MTVNVVSEDAEGTGSTSSTGNEKMLVGTYCQTG